MRLFSLLWNTAVYKSLPLFFPAITFSLSSSTSSSYTTPPSSTPPPLPPLHAQPNQNQGAGFWIVFFLPSLLLPPELFFISTSVGALGWLTPAIPLICLHVTLSYYRRRQREALMGTLFLSFFLFFFPKAHSSKLPIKCHIVIYVFFSDGTKVPRREHPPSAAVKLPAALLTSLQVDRRFCPVSAAPMLPANQRRPLAARLHGSRVARSWRRGLILESPLHG